MNFYRSHITICIITRSCALGSVCITIGQRRESKEVSIIFDFGHFYWGIYIHTTLDKSLVKKSWRLIWRARYQKLSFVTAWQWQWWRANGGIEIPASWSLSHLVYKTKNITYTNIIDAILFLRIKTFRRKYFYILNVRARIPREIAKKLKKSSAKLILKDLRKILAQDFFNIKNISAIKRTPD